MDEMRFVAVIAVLCAAVVTAPKQGSRQNPYPTAVMSGGPTECNYGAGPQPHDNSGFDAEGGLKPAYAKRIENIIAAADRNGMVVIVGLFSFGQDRRFSWVGGVGQRGTAADRAMQAVDYAMFHTNGRTLEDVHQGIFDMRRWVGYSRPVMINEDDVTSLNLHAAVQERVGWGC